MREAITDVPLIVDAGVGTASDAAIAMELGYDGVLLNTAIAEAEDSELMARAMKLAVEAGRAAFLSGRMAKREYAVASSPLLGADWHGVVSKLFQRVMHISSQTERRQPGFLVNRHTAAGGRFIQTRPRHSAFSPSGLAGMGQFGAYVYCTS